MRSRRPIQIATAAFLTVSGGLAQAESPSCPRGTGFNDGCQGASAGSPQYPNLLSGNFVRPGWNVAGVDYHVGVPEGKDLKDWQTLKTNPPVGLEWDARGYFRCNSGNIVIDGYDFTTGKESAGFYGPVGGCSGLLITNSKFGCYPAAGLGVNALGFNGINIQGDINFVFKYNTMDFSQCRGSGNGANGAITLGVYACKNSAANCRIDVEYNYIRDLYNTFLGFFGVYTSFINRYNVLENPATSTVGDPQKIHMNSQSGLGSGSYSPIFTHNVTFSSQSYAGGELPQFYYNGGGTIVNPVVTNNVFPHSTGNVSYMVHGNGAYSPPTNLIGTGIFKDNFFDPRDTFGAIYPNSLNGWTSSGNVNMTNGAVINP